MLPIAGSSRLWRGGWRQPVEHGEFSGEVGGAAEAGHSRINWIGPQAKGPHTAGPPPAELEVRVLEEGSGRRAKPGQTLQVQYVAASYETGKLFEVRWGKSGPFVFNFGSGEALEGWDIGLKGMRVGERRELQIPSKLAYGSGALLYVIELLAIGAL